jgi:hypothetical protein
MKKNPVYWTAALLALSTLQACSDKTVSAPPAAVVVPVAAPAPEAPKTASAKKLKPLPKAATMQCADRTIVLEASCLDLAGPEMLQCTRQTLVVSDAASGKVLNTRTFAAVAGEGAEPATVEEKVGEMTCVTTKTGAKYIVTNMFNGGNCEECEWNEVYGWDGAFLGSDRDKKKKVQVVDDAVAAIAEKDVDRVTGVNDVAGFYSEPVKK